MPKRQQSTQVPTLTDEVIMDTAHPKGRLKAFFKHATIRISSTKDHGFLSESASTHSIDDDGRSQRSSISSKKDSKLRRIGRGIREWRSKRRRLRGDARSNNSFTLGGKSFSSSEASLPEESSEDEDFTDEDEPADRSDDHNHEAGEVVPREAPVEKFPCEIIHEEVAVRPNARDHVTPRGSQSQSQTQSGRDVTVPQTPIALQPPPPIYVSFVEPDLAPRDRSLEQTGIVFRRDRKHALDFAQSTLSSEPVLWTDASHRPLGLKTCNPEHRGGIAVAQRLDQRWTVHSAYTSGVTDIMQLESLAILVALLRAVQEVKSGTLRDGTVYIFSDSDFSLEWIEKVLATAIRWAVQEVRALEADVDGLDCRLGQDNGPEQSLTASIGRWILEQYYELRRLGAYVEFHWVPARSGLPGNEIADRIAVLSCWWLAKVAPRPVQGAALVVPLKVLTFDEPWTRYCPHKGQPQYNERNALQLLEDTKSSCFVLPTKALLRSANRNIITQGPVGARPGPDGLALQPVPESTCRLLQSPSVQPYQEAEEARRKPPEPCVRTQTFPDHNMALELRHQVGPIPQPPPPFPQLQSQGRGKKPRKQRPAAFENVICVHCWHKGHLIHQCFEKFPEQKLAFPQRYARYVGRPLLEKVIPGALHNIARLHPQLLHQPIHGQDSMYTVGRIGISSHLTPGQCAVWAVRYQAVQPGQDATAVVRSAQDYRRHPKEEYGGDEAQDAQLD